MPRVLMTGVMQWLRVVSGVLAVLPMTGVAQAQQPKVVAVSGKPVLLLSSFDLAPFGYATEEFFISGAVTSYTLAEAATADGKWKAVPAESAPYVTRIVVVRPTDPRKFNGTVAVEWLNVTAGTDAAPDWSMTHRELLRSGYAYVAVSAQKVGIDGAATPGGMSAMGTALKKQNPERYGSLNHPGDSYSFDIYSQAGRLVRAAATNKVLGPLVPKRVLAIGESQSAAFLTTYINAVDPLAKVYDGFLVHSRFGGAASLQAATMAGQDQPRTIKFRPDLRVPVIAVETETDVLDGRMPGYRGARQPDHDRLRVWEVPGTAHADNYSFGAGMIDSGTIPIEKLAAAWAPTSEILGAKLAKPINNAPQHHYVVQNALASLDRWVGGGKSPPKAEPMKMKDGQGDTPATFVLDANGLTEGGVRTPWVDVPVTRLSGTGNSGSPLAFLAGASEPFDAATLDRLYPGGKKEYLKKFEASLDSAIKAGFILSADRKEILDLAAHGYHGSH